MEAQHTLGWYRVRLGRITGSSVGLLMKSGRGGGPSETALSYLYQVAAERAMNQSIVENDALFEAYLKEVEVTSKAMRFGNEQEPHARELYGRITGQRMVEVGAIPHPTIPGFSSSPDGFYYNESTGERRCLEIKCPSQAVFMKYSTEVREAADLLRVKPEYYWQTVAHMAVSKAEATDFVAYCPFQAAPIHIVTIPRREADVAVLEDAVIRANEIINRILNT